MNGITHKIKATSSEVALGIPSELLLDDNHAQVLCLPRDFKSLPLSSAPQYTLYRLIRHLKPKSILEIGTQCGASAFAMALAFRDNHIDIDITCVDPFYPTGDNDGLSTLMDWYNNIYASGFKAGIQLLLTTSEQILPIMNKQFDFVFVDGSHRYEDVKQDCYLTLSLLRDGGCFLVHDYIIYDSVERACNEIVGQHSLPFHVNSVQTNYRGELCGWIIARKTKNLTRDFHYSSGSVKSAWIKRHIPSSAKDLYRRVRRRFDTH